MKTRKIVFGLVFVLLLIGNFSCDKTFEYSPYSANVDNNQLSTNQKQWSEMDLAFKNPASFSFAVISDVHFNYTQLGNMVNQINNDAEIDFVIVAGDISDQALLKEYELYYDIMKGLNKPYFTLIGNHDYNANGEKIYQEMFGDYNFDFEYQNVHFVFFDNVIWESNKTPKFDWLSESLKANSSKLQFVFAHIPPFGDQFTNEMEQKYSQIMKENDVSMSIHGHTHSYYLGEKYHDEIPYLTVPWAKEETYAKISVVGQDFDLEMVH